MDRIELQKRTMRSVTRRWFELVATESTTMIEVKRTWSPAPSNAIRELLMLQNETRTILRRLREDLENRLQQAGQMFGYQDLTQMLDLRASGELSPYMAYLFEDSRDRFEGLFNSRFDVSTEEKFEKLRSLINLAQIPLGRPLHADYDPALVLVGAVDMLIRGCEAEGLIVSETDRDVDWAGFVRRIPLPSVEHADYMEQAA